MAKDGHFTNGHGIRIVFVDSGLSVYEKSVTPGGSEGGDPIDITTNDNVSKMSKAPRTLTEDTPLSAEVTYNNDDYDALEAIVNESNDIRLEWPDDTTQLKSGWLRSVTPNQATRGEQPTAALAVEYQGEAPV